VVATECTDLSLPLSITMYAGLTANTVTKSRYEVEISDTDQIPEGVENITHAVVTAPDETKENVCVWAEPARDQTIEIVYKNVQYTAAVEDDIPEKIVITVEDDKITNVNTGELKNSVACPNNCPKINFVKELILSEDPSALTATKVDDTKYEIEVAKNKIEKSEEFFWRETFKVTDPTGNVDNMWIWIEPAKEEKTFGLIYKNKIYNVSSDASSLAVTLEEEKTKKNTRRVMAVNTGDIKTAKKMRKGFEMPVPEKLLTATATAIDDSSYKIQLEGVKLQELQPGKTPVGALIDTPDGGKEYILFAADIEQDMELFMLYKNYMYEAKIEDKDISELVITYGELKTTECNIEPVKVNSGTLEEIKNKLGKYNDPWKKENIYQMKYLENLKLEKDQGLDNVKLNSTNLRPADFLAAAQLIGRAKNIRLEMEGMSLTGEQWKEIAGVCVYKSGGGKIREFWLEGNTMLDAKSGPLVAMICAITKSMVILQGLEFEDFAGFIGTFESQIKLIGKEGCGRLSISWPRKRMIKKYRQAVLDMTERLGWKVKGDDGDGLDDSDDEENDPNKFQFVKKSYMIDILA